jgi:acyl carrier protein
MYKIECPHCEHEIDIAYIEVDTWEEECPSCYNAFEVNVESEPVLSTRKYNIVECIKCGSKFDKTWYARYPMPNGMGSDANLCEQCYGQLIFKELRMSLQEEANINQIVIDTLCEQLEIKKNQITLESKLISDLGADSLDLIEVEMALEEKLKVKNGDHSQDHFKCNSTVKELIDYAIKRKKELDENN